MAKAIFEANKKGSAPALDKVASPAPVGEMRSQDEQLYAITINENLKLAEINNVYFKSIEGDRREASKLSAAERARSPVLADALATTKAGSRFVDIAGCLNDQKQRGVGYYQGKSTCTAMFP